MFYQLSLRRFRLNLRGGTSFAGRRRRQGSLTGNAADFYCDNIMNLIIRKGVC
jgi:hypothetical protein